MPFLLRSHLSEIPPILYPSTLKWVGGDGALPGGNHSHIHCSGLFLSYSLKRGRAWTAALKPTRLQSMFQFDAGLALNDTGEVESGTKRLMPEVWLHSQKKTPTSFSYAFVLIHLGTRWKSNNPCPKHVTLRGASPVFQSEVTARGLPSISCCCKDRPGAPCAFCVFYWAVPHASGNLSVCWAWENSYKLFVNPLTWEQ